MSLDFTLKKIQPTEVFYENYTHNVTPMWELAGIYNDLYNSNGKKAKDIIENLKIGYHKMLNEPVEFEKLNPENKWGSYGTALEFLKEVIQGCEEYPDSTIIISK